MKYLFTFIILIHAIFCKAQTGSPVTFGAVAHFNIAQNGLATNDAGIGLGLDVAFFAKHKLQLLVESGMDQFIGDKLLITDAATGEHARTRPLYSINGGPQFLITKNLAVSITYGPAWHQVRAFEYSRDYGFKYSLSSFLGKKRHIILKGFVVNIAVPEQHIRYLGFAGGYRF